jgi:hypothetical protein
MRYLLNLKSTYFILDLASLTNLYPDGSQQFPEYPLALKKWGANNSVSLFRFVLKSDANGDRRIEAKPLFIQIEVEPYYNNIILPVDYAETSGWLTGLAKTIILYYVKGDGNMMIINRDKLYQFAESNNMLNILTQFKNVQGLRMGTSVDTRDIKDYFSLTTLSRN